MIHNIFFIFTINFLIVIISHLLKENLYLEVKGKLIVKFLYYKYYI